MAATLTHFDHKVDVFICQCSTDLPNVSCKGAARHTLMFGVFREPCCVLPFAVKTKLISFWLQLNAS